MYQFQKSRDSFLSFEYCPMSSPDGGQFLSSSLSYITKLNANQIVMQMYDHQMSQCNVHLRKDDVVVVEMRERSKKSITSVSSFSVKVSLKMNDERGRHAILTAFTFSFSRPFSFFPPTFCQTRASFESVFWLIRGVENL